MRDDMTRSKPSWENSGNHREQRNKWQMRHRSMPYRVLDALLIIFSLFMCIAGFISFLQGGKFTDILPWAFLLCLSLVSWSMILIERRRKKPSLSEVPTE